jgi:hypothetical protein
MNHNNPPLSGPEEESFKQKISLVISMSGSTVETSLSVLLYALSHITVSNHVEFASVIRAFADIYMHHPNLNDDDEDDEGDE